MFLILILTIKSRSNLYFKFHISLFALLIMGCSLPPLGGTGACYRFFTNIAKILRLFHWLYNAYTGIMLHIRKDNCQ